MKKIVLLLTFVAFIIGCSNETTNTDQKVSTEEAVVELTLIELGEFDSLAGNFVDKEVKVAGIVDHVCKHGGKKLLLVNDNGDVHINSEERFDDALVGSEVTVIGIVREFRVDEGYCLKMEEDNIANHKDGGIDEEELKEEMDYIQEYRDEMTEKNVDHLSYYSLDYVSMDEVIGTEKTEATEG